jgi:hypothetical protein
VVINKTLDQENIEWEAITRQILSSVLKGTVATSSRKRSAVLSEEKLAESVDVRDQEQTSLDLLHRDNENAEDGYGLTDTLVDDDDEV